MYLAIDIGGTKTLVALFSRGGRKLKAIKFPTSQNQNRFLDELVRVLQGFAGRNIQGVAVAIPGIIEKNYSFRFGNLPWRNIDLVTPIKKLFHCPVWFENDAHLATVFEAHRRQGRTVYLTFSTGIGGGIADNGELMRDMSVKFEPGHWIYQYQGQKLEWEDIASCNAVGAVFGTVATSVRGKNNHQEIARRISLGMVDIIKTLKPNLIVVGGPMGRVFPRIKKYLRNDLRSTLGDEFALPKIVKAKKPTESVIFGCYLFAREQAKKNA